MGTTNDNFTCHGLRKATIFDSECVEAHELWSDSPRRLFEVVLSDNGCEDTCRHLRDALAAIGPWAETAAPDSETEDPSTGAVCLLLTEPQTALQDA